MTPPIWRQIQKTNFSDVQSLCDFLSLDPTNRSKVILKPKFPLIVPRRLASKMGKNTLNDPIVRQFLPLNEELNIEDGFLIDPLFDYTFCKSKKLVQKYKGRALLVTSGACAMNCRFCFRQNFDYSSPSNFDEELELLRSDTSIHEVILSGGDPLSLSDETLKILFNAFNEMDHIQLIRFHTRFPMGIPERIDPSFLDLLRSSNKQIVFIIHSNHCREWDPDVIEAMKSIGRLGIVLLLQTVLLKGVNDDVETLKELYQKCISIGVIPYYLHQLDRVAGATHFETTEDKGRALIKELKSCLPGYAVPRYVREIPGELSKTEL